MMRPLIRSHKDICSLGSYFLFTSLLLSLVVVSGCVAEADTKDNDNTVDGGHIWPDGMTNNNNTNTNTNNNSNGNWQPPLNSRVYVHTRDTLYYIDPSESQDMVEVGDFQGPCTDGSGFYDIAVDGAKNMLGISAEALYSVNSETAACSLVFEFPEGSPHFFSLSYVKGVDPEFPNVDALIAASVEEGEWVLIDYPGENISNIFVHLGYYDPASKEWLSSGDITSIQTGFDDYVTYATLKCPNYEGQGCESDWLARIDPVTGSAQLIGETGYQQIFGLGFWGDEVYGFTSDGEYIVIDVETGEGTLVEEYPERSFWGAGNTTKAHVVF